ncbi:MAG: ABC transporter permease [Anaerolineales bacterium]|nr:ABC transporter permease [Anaerolineales bacterium]
MTNYIIRRLLIMPLTLFGVTVLIFGMMMFLSPEERSALYVRDIPKNEATMDGIIRRYGLADPVYVQYWHWLVGREDPITGDIRGGILRGDFGYSRSSSQPVIGMLKRRFPATVELTLYTVIPIILIGVWLGIQAAVNHNKFIDQVARIFAILGHSLPSFIFALLALMIFYAELRWFPPGRLSDWASAVVASPEWRNYTYLLTIDSWLNARPDIFVDALRHLILPVTVLSTISWATYLRVTRSSMLETLRQEYVTTARSKGLKEKDVVSKHARPNALIPVATLSGLTVAGLLGGAVITETVFEFPGIGQAAGQAAAQLDVVAVLSFTLLAGFILIIANLIVDVMYAFLDPRVRLS